MHLRYWFIAVVLGLALAIPAGPSADAVPPELPARPAASAGADTETDKALATIKAVKKEGKGNDDAGPAWKTLVSKGGPALLPALEAFDDSNPTAANWLRTAVDAIAENEKAAGRKLPVDKLEAFATNPKFAASARRIAYELLLSQDPSAKDRLLPGFLNDKSPELRRDAIAAELEKLERAARPTTKADLEKLFTHTRDKDQVELLAKKIAANGGKANVTEHFAFLTHGAFIGPFDAPESKGFDLSYPPDTAKDASGKFKGKGGAELTWKPASTTEKYGTFDLNKILGKHKDAVAYLLAVVEATQDTPCDIRVTSITSVKIFLNQKELFGRDEYHHGAPLDANIGKGVLKKGENVIVVKVCQNNQKEDWAQSWQFQVRVCDDTGGPLSGVLQVVSEGGTTKKIKLGFNPNPTEDTEDKK
jgi:hypothetical protein